MNAVRGVDNGEGVDDDVDGGRGVEGDNNNGKRGRQW